MVQEIPEDSVPNGTSRAPEMDSGEEQKMLPVTEEKPKIEEMDLEIAENEIPVTDETRCGYGFCSGSFLQKFANKKIYVLLFGVSGAFFNSSFAYFNGTISTIEKRFKIPSRNSGIISVGNDISLMLVSIFVTYYAGKGHKPRWMAAGLFMLSAFCLMTSLPHFIYGGGSVESFTVEHGFNPDKEELMNMLEQEKRKTLCNANLLDAVKCEIDEGNWGPQIIFFTAQVIAGVGAALYSSLGTAYMDDNVKKSKTPALMSLSFFIRMMGPAFGYALASFSVNMFVSPTLTPTITKSDPRWIGSWWFGWFFLGIVLFFFASLMSLFPRHLPRAFERRRLAAIKRNEGKPTDTDDPEENLPASFQDMMSTIKRLFTNKIFMFNNCASIFYFFGFTPYWIFTPKYMESQFHKTASDSNLYTGSVAFAFVAIGILTSGFVVSRYKPSARKMAAWNCIVGALTTLGYLSYTQIGCAANDNAVVMNENPLDGALTSCNSNCHCDYVKYAPVCGEDGHTYISACHAGCTDQIDMDSSSTSKLFTNCSCILSSSLVNATDGSGGTATPGACPVDCTREFNMFLIVMCILKLLASTGMATNFLICIRCIDEKDKSISLGFSFTVTSLFAFIPSPIVFGAVMDSTCILWGKTCSGTGNCWRYDGPSLRYFLNSVTSLSIAIAVIFDLLVWYYVKDLVVFDEKEEVTGGDEKEKSNS